MKPIDFTQQTKVLQRPNSMKEEECGPLPIFNDGKHCISKWRMSFKERLHCLFKGYLWLSIMSGKTQPPVSISAKKTRFIDE